MGLHLEERIVLNARVALDSKVLKHLAYESLKTGPTLVDQAFELVQLRIGQVQSEDAHG